MQANVVILGASNVAMNISLIIAMAQRALGQPLNVLGAYGHGRSYGTRSTVMARSLPGITECGVWDALERAGDRPTYALVTDIGNDIMYGRSADTIAQWVEHCLARLQNAGATIAVMSLPLASVRTLDPWRFNVARALIFPGRTIEFSRAVSTVELLDQRIERLAQTYGSAYIIQPVDWFGFDPVHIRRHDRPQAWAAAMKRWTDQPMTASNIDLRLVDRLALRVSLPQRFALLGREICRSQPSACLACGTSLSRF